MKVATTLALPLAGFAAGVLATLLFGRLSTPHGEEVEVAAAGTAQDASAPGPGRHLVGKAPPDAGDASLLRVEPGQAETARAVRKKHDAQEAQSEWQQRWQEQASKRTAEQNRIRLAYLTEALGLTPPQVAALEKSLAAGTPERTQAAAPGNVAALAKGAVISDPLDGALAAILTPEQAQAYGKLKEKERGDKIEARAMQRFAALPGTLSLTDEQKDRVFEVFAAEEAGRLDSQSAAGANVLSFTTSAGGGLLSESVVVNLSEAVVAVASTGSADPQSSARNAAQTMQERIARSNEERIEALRPILTERQIEAYRSHLESSNGMFGGNLQIEVSTGNPSQPKQAGE